MASLTHQTLDSQAVLRLCNGNVEAMEWIQIGRYYCHEIDDLIDETIPRADKIEGIERVCRIGALALRLYTHPFFLKNIEALRAVMMLNTINYRDSVRWEDSGMEWQKQFSDVMRHGWCQVALIVGDICGGYEAVSNESMELHAAAYFEHHTKEGKAN